MKYSDKCGTYAGVQAHIRSRDPLCEPCREARNAYRRRYHRRPRKLPEFSYADLRTYVTGGDA